MSKLRETVENAAGRGILAGLNGISAVFSALDRSADRGNIVSHRIKSAIEAVQDATIQAAERVLETGFSEPESQSLSARFARRVATGAMLTIGTINGLIYPHTEEAKRIKEMCDYRDQVEHTMDTAIREQFFPRLTGEARRLTDELLADGVEPLTFYSAADACAMMARRYEEFDDTSTGAEPNLTEFTFDLNGTAFFKNDSSLSADEFALEIARFTNLWEGDREAPNGIKVHPHAYKLLRWTIAAARDEPDAFIGFHVEGTDAAGNLLMKEIPFNEQPEDPLELWKVKTPPPPATPGTAAQPAP